MLNAHTDIDIDQYHCLVPEAFSPIEYATVVAQPVQNSCSTSCYMPQHQVPDLCQKDWHRSPGPVRTQSLHP